MDQSTTLYRRCSKCGEMKLISEFHTNGSRGWYSQCRICARQSRRDAQRRRALGIPLVRPSTEELFLSKFDKGDGSGCWIWLAALDHRGYGKFRAFGKIILAHRYSYLYHVGPIPDGMSVLHHCDTRACVRPDHLYTGTHEDNMRDMSVRDRVAGRKLTADDARSIRQLFASGVAATTLADQFGITFSTVYRIVNRRYWRHV